MHRCGDINYQIFELFEKERSRLYGVSLSEDSAVRLRRQLKGREGEIDAMPIRQEEMRRQGKATYCEV